MSGGTLVVGSGIAGLFTALRASALGPVTLVTKSHLEDTNTRYAQGGIAAATSADDVAVHAADTVAAGAGLCDEEAVRILCREGPDRVEELLRTGVAFDREDDAYARGLEAAHSRPRVLHAGGDATGAAIERALATAVRAAGVRVREHTFLTDLVRRDGAVVGARFLDGSEERAGVVVLASGGSGRAFRFTTNPEVATGDGVAVAFRAGAVVADAEMYQFHPTLLAVGAPFLVSEAVRGAGAVLRDRRGERFVDELAPRDVVARAIGRRMDGQDGEPVSLDATALGAAELARRFPTIDAHCRSLGLDWSRAPVPVAPAAHFWMGGIATDSWGRTSLPGLYAVGEVACTGVHGANRLASNSLLEGIVFGHRAVASFGTPWPAAGPWAGRPAPRPLPDAVAGPSTRPVARADVQRLAWDHLGLVRQQYGLQLAAKQLADWAAALPEPATAADHELRNLVTVARLVAAGASARRESRGAHFRADQPAPDAGGRHRIAWVRQPR